MNETLPLLEQYFSYLQLIRNHTVYSIRGARSSWGFFLRENKVKSIEQITKEVVESWLMKGRLDRHWKATTYITYHKHLSGFFDWLVKRNIITENNIKKIEKPKLEKNLPRRLTQEEANNLMMAARSMRYAYRFESKRNYAIVATMLLAGLRKSEVLNLKMVDIDLHTGTLSVILGKGNKDRLVPICSKLSSVLSEYIMDRNRLNKQCNYLFTAVQKDQRIEHRCLQNMMHRLRKKTGLDFSSHTLRHSFATMMLEGGCDIYTLSKMMGHNKITTTTIYLACSTKLMLTSIEKHPLN